MKSSLCFVFVLFSFYAISQPNIQWQRCYGGSMNDGVGYIQPTNDGGYIMVGATLSNDGDVTGYHGNQDCWVVKLGSSGCPPVNISYLFAQNQIHGSVNQF